MDSTRNLALRPFLSWPSDIRSLIYTCLFEDASYLVPEHCTYHPELEQTWHQYVYFGDFLEPETRADPILRTCKSIYHEARPLFAPTLTLQIRRGPPTMPRRGGSTVRAKCHLSAVPAAILQCCRSVRLAFDGHVSLPWDVEEVFDYADRRIVSSLGYLPFDELRSRLPKLTTFCLSLSERRRDSPHPIQSVHLRATQVCREYLPLELLEQNQVLITYSHTLRCSFEPNLMPDGCKLHGSLTFVMNPRTLETVSTVLRKDCAGPLEYRDEQVAGSGNYIVSSRAWSFTGHRKVVPGLYHDNFELDTIEQNPSHLQPRPPFLVSAFAPFSMSALGPSSMWAERHDDQDVEESAVAIPEFFPTGKQIRRDSDFKKPREDIAPSTMIAPATWPK